MSLTTNVNAINDHTANPLPTLMDDYSAVTINPTSITDPTQQCLPPWHHKLESM